MATSQALSAQRMYNARAANYNDSWHPLHANSFVSQARVKSHSHILDLACGTGLGMLAVARGSAEKEGVVPYVKFIQHDITCLDTLPPGTLREEGYDIITCASALPLLDDPGAAMRHWAGYLAAGGMLVVDAPTERSAIPGLVFEHVMRELNAKSRLPWSRQWIRNASSLEDLVRSAGLEIERSEILSGFESGGIFNVGQAAEMFQKLMGGPAASELRELGDEFKDKAEDLFIETWKKHAIEGEIREEEGFYLVIGRKPG